MAIQVLCPGCRGDWYLCLPVAIPVDPAPGVISGRDRSGAQGHCSHRKLDGERLAAGQFYRSLEVKIAQAQRKVSKRQAKRLHRQARRRQNATQFSRRIVNQYQNIFIGDVSSLKLVKTRMAKSVLDTGLGILKTQLLYKGEYRSGSVRIVNEQKRKPHLFALLILGPTGVNGRCR